MPGLQPLATPLGDGEIALREWRDGDGEAIVDPLNDPEIARWTQVPSPYTRSDAAEFIASMRAALARGDELALAIASAASGELLGSISVRLTSLEHRRGEIGYLVFRGARGRGVAPRAVRLLARHAIESAGLARVGILTAVGNAGSQRVAEKAGFTREGVLRSYMRVGRGRDDMVSWSLLPDDLGAPG